MKNKVLSMLILILAISIFFGCESSTKPKVEKDDSSIEKFLLLNKIDENNEIVRNEYFWSIYGSTKSYSDDDFVVHHSSEFNFENSEIVNLPVDNVSGGDERKIYFFTNEESQIFNRFAWLDFNDERYEIEDFRGVFTESTS